jgi:hypothetical protein
MHITCKQCKGSTDCPPPKNVHHRKKKCNYKNGFWNATLCNQHNSLQLLHDAILLINSLLRSPPQKLYLQISQDIMWLNSARLVILMTWVNRIKHKNHTKFSQLWHCQSDGWIYYIQFLPWKLMQYVLPKKKKKIHTYEITLHHNPGDHNMKFHHHKNLKS